MKSEVCYPVGTCIRNKTAVYKQQLLQLNFTAACIMHYTNVIHSNPFTYNALKHLRAECY